MSLLEEEETPKYPPPVQRKGYVRTHQEANVWVGGVAQAVGHLLCKHEVLSSNYSPTKKKKRKKVAKICLQARRTTKTSPAGILVLDFQPPELEKTHLYCLNHPGCGLL
jgi:hypothetical protein